MNFRTMAKSLRLSWIGRFLDGTNPNWKTITAYFFNKYGGLTFLLKCNYDVNLFEANLYYGTTRTYQLTKKHCFGKLGSNVEFIMCKTS